MAVSAPLANANSLFINQKTNHHHEKHKHHKKPWFKSLYEYCLLMGHSLLYSFLKGFNLKKEKFFFFQKKLLEIQKIRETVSNWAGPPKRKFNKKDTEPESNLLFKNSKYITWYEIVIAIKIEMEQLFGQC